MLTQRSRRTSRSTTTRKHVPYSQSITAAPAPVIAADPAVTSGRCVSDLLAQERWQDDARQQYGEQNAIAAVSSALAQDTEEALRNALAVVKDARRAFPGSIVLQQLQRLLEAILWAHDASARSLLDQIAEPLRVAARADALALGPAEHPSGVGGITVGIAV